jgi:pSer/pThr/pTyr-binding forkhead associated (FHA) protein
MNEKKYPKLTIISSQNRGTVFVLKKKRYSCGRSELNDIVFDDSSVSSSHCELLKNDNSYIIRDVGSANGTIVNDVLIDERELKNNDIVNVGRMELLYDAEISEETSVLGVNTGIDPDLYNNKTSLIDEMKNISPFADKNGYNRLLQIGIMTVIVLLALVVLGLLVWLFTIFYYQ